MKNSDEPMFNINWAIAAEVVARMKRVAMKADGVRSIIRWQTWDAAFEEAGAYGDGSLDAMRYDRCRRARKGAEERIKKDDPGARPWHNIKMLDKEGNAIQGDIPEEKMTAFQKYVRANQWYRNLGRDGDRLRAFCNRSAEEHGGDFTAYLKFNPDSLPSLPENGDGDEDDDDQIEE